MVLTISIPTVSCYGRGPSVPVKPRCFPGAPIGSMLSIVGCSLKTDVPVRAPGRGGIPDLHGGFEPLGPFRASALAEETPLRTSS